MDFPIKNGDFSIVMFVYQRVSFVNDSEQIKFRYVIIMIDNNITSLFCFLGID